jgi:hypothetical protein
VTARLLAAAFAYFALAFGAGFALAPVRLLWLAPRIGTRAAELVELPVMLAVTWLAARFVTRRFEVPQGRGPRLAMGWLAATLLLAAEFTLVLRLRGLTLEDYFATRDPVSGTAYYVAVLLLALMPLWVNRRRAAGPPAA